MSSSTIIRFGIIGTGGRGQDFCRNNHLPGEGYVVAAGADTNPGALAAFSAAFPEAKAFSDYRELLAMPQIDAVFVITPDFLHEEMACAALKAGKHVYLEKPLAITIEGCQRILRCAMENRRKLYVGHNMRFYPAILKMKELIDSGVIGQVQCAWCRHFISYGGDAYFHDWHSERRNTTGLLLQKGAHDIDVLHWLMGSYTTAVTAMGMLSVYDKCPRRAPGTPGKADWGVGHYPPEECNGFSPVIDVEDHNMVLMQLASGQQAAYLQCHYTPDADRNYTFIGTRGRIENRGVAEDSQVMLWTHRSDGLLPDVTYTLRGSAAGHSGADPEIMRNFREWLRGAARPVTSPVDAMRAVMTGVMAHETMRGDLNVRRIPEVPADLLAYFGQTQ